MLVQKPFQDIITFTRASSATRFNAAGVLETVSNNVPRIDYDPVTLACRGLLIGEQRTNMLLNSATLATQNVTVSGVAKTLSFTGTGSITLSGAHSATLSGAGANNRVTLTFTPSAGTLTLTVSGDVRNAQLEIGAFATSWIPTTGAHATRAADVAQINTLSPWYNQSEGTVLLDKVVLHSYTGSPWPKNGIFRGSTNPRSEFFNADYALQTGVDAFVSDEKVVGMAVAAPSVRRVAMAYKLNNYAVCANGGAVSTDLIAAVPAVTSFRFAEGGWTGYIRKIRYFPKRLSNAELQALTA